MTDPFIPIKQSSEREIPRNSFEKDGLGWRVGMKFLSILPIWPLLQAAFSDASLGPKCPPFGFLSTLWISSCGILYVLSYNFSLLAASLTTL